MKIVLISCVSKKAKLRDTEKIEARRLYTSTLFKSAWEYAQQILPDKIYILSAKHKLLNPETEIESYNETLNKMSVSAQKDWAEDVLKQLQAEGLDLQNDEFIILAGKNYYKNIIGEGKIENYTLPYSGLKGIGYILKFLKDKNNDTIKKY